MIPARRNQAWLVWLWLLLATIATHAVLPSGSPLARTAGSAFSATTIDVTLTPQRKGILKESHRLEPETAGSGSGSGGQDFREASPYGPATDLHATKAAGSRPTRSAAVAPQMRLTLWPLGLARHLLPKPVHRPARR